MLEAISEYVKNIAYFMVLSSLCAFLLPEDRGRSAVSFITGLMLMLIVLKPINALLGAEAENSIVKNGIRLQQRAACNSLEQYGGDAGEMAVLEAFEKACEDMIKTETGAERVSIRAESGEDGIYIEAIEVYSHKTQELGEKIARLCGISEDKITVINEQGEEYNEAD